MKVYKFRDFDGEGYSLDALRNSYAWFSSPAELNDPFEGYSNAGQLRLEGVPERFMFRMYNHLLIELEMAQTLVQAEQITRERYIRDPEGFKEVQREAVESFLKELADGRDSLGIFSTSISSDEHGIPAHYQNMLMWAHYGGGFKGFCIEWSQPDLMDSFERLNETVRVAGKPISYSVSPNICNFDEAEHINEVSMSFYKSLQVKHEQWRYECEYRFLAQSHGQMFYSNDAITAIYVGGRISEENLSQLIDIVREVGSVIPIYRVDVAYAHNDYGLSLSRIDYDD